MMNSAGLNSNNIDVYSDNIFNECFLIMIKGNIIVMNSALWEYSWDER
jgi:hypothetical protein